MTLLLVPLLLIVLLITPVSAQPAGQRAFSDQVLVVSAPGEWPGKIFVSHDEWVFSDYAFGVAPDTGRSAVNLAAWFTEGRNGRFLAYSSNFGLTGAALAATMQAAGHSWTVSTAVPVTVTSLLKYDAIFLAGTPVDNQVLIDYVRVGGNVFLAAGTGWRGGAGRAAEEAAAWNEFLNAFGISLLPFYHEIPYGILAVESGAPPLKGVFGLYQYRGNPIEALNGASLLYSFDGYGLYGVYSSPTVAVPVELAPGTCTNRTTISSHSAFRVAIAGSARLDAAAIEVQSVRLLGIGPRSSALVDVSSPSFPVLGKTNASTCATLAPDGYVDLVLTFETDRLLTAIEALLEREVRDGEVFAVVLRGGLTTAAGLDPIVGEAILVIQRPAIGSRSTR